MVIYSYQNLKQTDGEAPRKNCGLIKRPFLKILIKKTKNLILL